MLTGYALITNALPANLLHVASERSVAFSALKLLVGNQEVHWICKNLLSNIQIYIWTFCGSLTNPVYLEMAIKIVIVCVCVCSVT